VEKSVAGLAARIVADGLIEDNPRKLWACWAEVVNSCRRGVTPDAHTHLLGLLVDGSGADATSGDEDAAEEPTPPDVIADYIAAVLRAPDPHAATRDPARRFRPLPSMLARDRPGDALSDSGSDASRRRAAGSEASRSDLLAKVADRLRPRDGAPRAGSTAAAPQLDPEMAVFDALTAGTPIGGPAAVSELIAKHPDRGEALFGAKVAGAMLTHALRDPAGAAVDRLAGPLRAVAASSRGGGVGLVVECFLTWRCLGESPPRGFSGVVERLLALGVISAATIEAAHRTIDPRLAKGFREAAGPSAQRTPSSK
jgi:hypothetical protein